MVSTNNIKTRFISLLTILGITVLSVSLFGGSVSAASVSSTFTPMPAGQNDLISPSIGFGAQVTSNQASIPIWTTTAPQPGDPGDGSWIPGVTIFSAAYNYSPTGLCSSDTIDKISIKFPNFSGVSGGGDDAAYYNISIDGGSSLYTGNKDVSSLNFGGPFAWGGGVFAPPSYALDTYTIAISPGSLASSLSSIILYELRDMGEATTDGTTQVNLDTPTITVDYTEDPACVSSNPIATDPDISATPASTPVTVNVLGNDTGTGLSVSKIDGQNVVSGRTITLSNGSGTVKLNSDGTITFTPAAGFTGESLFSYSITDGVSTVDTGVVRIAVAAATTSTTTAATTATGSAVLPKTGEDQRQRLMLVLGLIALGVLGFVGYKFTTTKKSKK